MITLYDKKGRAIIRLFDDWFVTFSEAKHLGWLVGDAVYNQSGKCIGWFDNGELVDLKGKILAKNTGYLIPPEAGIPGQPGFPTLSGRPNKPSFSSQWSEKNYKEFFS